MNIKGLGLHHLNSAESSQKTERKQQMKMESSGDRDANGRNESSDQRNDEPLTEEQIQKAISYLESHPGVKDNNLRVIKVNAKGKIFLLIEDYLNKVVRRIPENQIAVLANTSVTDEPSKGQLYHRAM